MTKGVPTGPPLLYHDTPSQDDVLGDWQQSVGEPGPEYGLEPLLELSSECGVRDTANAEADFRKLTCLPIFGPF